MKLLLLSGYFILIFSCKSNDTALLSYSNAFKSTVGYKMELKSKSLTVTTEADFNIDSVSNGLLKVNTIINKMTWQDGGSDIEKDQNNHLKQFTGVPYYFEMDSTGKIIKPLTNKETNEDASKIFDVKLFFPGYPAGLIKAGEKWEGSRQIHDMVFASVKTTSTLNKIDGDNCYVNMQYRFVEDTKMFTKKFEGLYLIDKNTGLLTSGNLLISGFNGFSNTSGTIQISRII
ncbi:MAG: hypothetical protein V4685_06455 [Bacteroidota bacterium]